MRKQPVDATQRNATGVIGIMETVRKADMLLEIAWYLHDKSW